MNIANDQEFARLRACWLTAMNEGDKENADIAHFAMCQRIDEKIALANRRYEMVMKTNTNIMRTVSLYRTEMLEAAKRALAAEARLAEILALLSPQSPEGSTDGLPG